jgi:hypothetical protein
MSSKNTSITLFLLGLALLILPLTGPSPVEAGIFRASGEVTYKEYWVPHTQFTGGCNEDGTPTNPSGTFYFEPFTLWKCPKTVAFTLPDDFTNAEKIEVYLDLWRNYDIQSARFKINDGVTVYNPGVGSNWSRTPAIMTIPKSEFKVGANTMTFWGSSLYHVHDIGIRIYYTDAKPLLPGPGSDVTPPTGQLVSIKDDSTTVLPDAGGVLTVNDNKLTLRAESLSADTAYVEFHAWYEGYDEDNDGVFRDWHNLGRNNWWPGGTEAKPTGGVINHVGTKAISGGATSAEIVWDIAHITNQAKIKFKIRVVDTAGNVREAAGGESAEFRMMRAAPVNAFILHGFTDAGLYMDGKQPPTATYNFTMPLNLSQFTNAYLIGAYWKNPKFSLNGNGGGAPVDVNATDWSLGIKSFSKSWLIPGSNQIIYNWWTGFGAFVEEPGPMFVLRNSNFVSDNAGPTVSKQVPAPNAKNVSINTTVVAHIGDEIYGVDWTTVEFKVNGVDMTAKVKLKGVMGDYQLVYTPDVNLAYGADYNIAIDACDMKGNCMATSYKFTTVAPDTTPPVISNITATATSVGANVSWNTNEPATSLVDYGLTTSYELGTVEATSLKTSHAMQITGLQSGKLYHYRVRGTDAQGNTGQSAGNTFTTLQFSAFISDDFRACVLDDSLWQFINPKGDVNHSLNTEQIEFTIPAGSAHDWSAGGSPPRFLQNIANSNLAIEIKFDSVVTQTGQMQGLIIEESATTYVRVVFERNEVGEPIMRTDFVRNGAVESSILYEFAKSAPAVVDPPPFMKITRETNVWKMYWSTDGASWTFAQPGKTFVMSVVRAGFFGGNSGAAGAQPQHKVVVDYIFNSNTKIAPEDGAAFSVNVTVMGNGSVTKTPSQSTYVCGDQVQLSATPGSGWSFAGWSGDATGAAPVIDVVVEGPTNVIATFIQPQYTLDVTINNLSPDGEGNSVTVTPQKALYSPGDTVVLEAKPIANWYFTGWSGSGLTGAQNPLTIIMEEDMAITATFSQNAPPVFTAIDAPVTTIGQLLTFQVEATDPGGQPVTLAYMPLPAGATFANNGNGKGTFSWQPAFWQGGEYEVTFIASDGSGQSSLTVKITVQGMGIAIPMIVGSG